MDNAYLKGDTVDYDDDVNHMEVVSQDYPIYRESLQDKFINSAKMLSQLQS